MATFSVNQGRQLYVETKLAAGKLVDTEKTVGEISIRASKDKGIVWIEHRGHGGITASDKIDVKNIVDMRATKSKNLAKVLDCYKVTLKGDIVAGQEYLLRLVFNQYVGMSDEDQYWKYGMVHAVKGMTADKFYKTMAISLVNNLAREETPLVKVFVHSLATTSASGFDANNLKEVTFGMKEDKIGAADIDALVITQVEQDWTLGTMPQAYIPFEVQPDTIIVEGDEVIWGEVKKLDATEDSEQRPVAVVPVEDGHNIADLEYFCMGERGDQYRMVGFPNVIRTKYLVDPTKKYDTLDIVYYYAGNNEDVQKSQRTLTIVAEDAGSNELMTALVAKFKSEAGLTIPFK